jgi:putative oxidoreductase
MTVAYLTADPESFKAFLSDPDKFASASPFIFLFVGLIVLFFGPGKYAIDSLVAKKLPARE